MNATQAIFILLVFLANILVGYSTQDVRLKVVLPALAVADGVFIAAIVFWL